MRYVICSKCKQKKQIRHTRYKELVSQYSSLSNFKKRYVCRNCRQPRLVQVETIKIKEPDSNELLFNELKEKIYPRVEWLHTNGIQHAQNRQLFYNMLKDLLSSYYISDFSINILENKVQSITLKKIPLIKEHILEIK